MSTWPQWATERVHLEEPQATWNSDGERLCRRLEVRLALWLHGPVQHVGSTAVPGLPAKPTLDVQAVLVVGSSRWFEQLAFRDALRADASLVHEYAQLKRSLAAAHDGDREAYTAGKAEFVRRVLEAS